MELRGLRVRVQGFRGLGFQGFLDWSLSRFRVDGWQIAGFKVYRALGYEVSLLSTPCPLLPLSAACFLLRMEGVESLERIAVPENRHDSTLFVETCNSLPQLKTSPNAGSWEGAYTARFPYTAPKAATRMTPCHNPRQSLTAACLGTLASCL